MNAINYSQCWEDPDILLEALEINKDDEVVSITSGGDNTLALLIAGPQAVISIDKNIAQNYLIELKIAATKSLSYIEYLEFLGVIESNRRSKLFKTVTLHLSLATSEWWFAHMSLIHPGVINCGRFERFSAFFAKYIIPLIHYKKTVQKLLSFDNVKEQAIFFDKKWNSGQWRFFLNLFSSRSILKRFARQRGMFAYAPSQNVADIYRKRMERHLTSVATEGNFFLHYSLTGKYGKTLPPYLEEKGYNRLCSDQKVNMTFVTDNLIAYLKSMPDNSFSKFNLSDIFEALSSVENDKLWEEIVRTAKPGSKVAYWNNLAHRSYPAYLSSKIMTDDRIVERLQAKDKVFFYDSFHVHTIIK